MCSYEKESSSRDEEESRGDFLENYIEIPHI